MQPWSVRPSRHDHAAVVSPTLRPRSCSRGPKALSMKTRPPAFFVAQDDRIDAERGTDQALELWRPREQEMLAYDLEAPSLLSDPQSTSRIMAGIFGAVELLAVVLKSESQLPTSAVKEVPRQSRLVENGYLR